MSLTFLFFHICLPCCVSFYVDIDECSTNEHDCDKNAKCINTEPGYKCQCDSGFKEYNDGRKCEGSFAYLNISSSKWILILDSRISICRLLSTRSRYCTRPIIAEFQPDLLLELIPLDFLCCNRRLSWNFYSGKHSTPAWNL